MREQRGEAPLRALVTKDLFRLFPACGAAVVVDIDGPAAGFAAPAFPFASDECTDAILFDCFQVLDHAHVIFRPVPLIQLLQPLAWKIAAGMAVPSFDLIAGRDCAVDAAQPVRSVTPPTAVLFPQECHTDGTVHAAGCNERCPERRSPGHIRVWDMSGKKPGGGVRPGDFCSMAGVLLVSHRKLVHRPTPHLLF